PTARTCRPWPIPWRCRRCVDWPTGCGSRPGPERADLPGDLIAGRLDRSCQVPALGKPLGAGQIRVARGTPGVAQARVGVVAIAHPRQPIVPRPDIGDAVAVGWVARMPAHG